MRLLWLLYLFIPVAVVGQRSEGISFLNHLTWDQIQQKAREDNKYIFVDCYATWCKPCYQMDKEVYVNENVREFFNPKFVSVKIQMDSSALDSDQIKEWYADAYRIKQLYRVNSFPTYLFFSPDGKFVHMELGFKNPDNLIQAAKNSLDYNKQYFTQIQRYRGDEKNYVHFPYLAELAKSLGEILLADSIAGDYFQDYLFRLNDMEILNKENLQFIYSFHHILKGSDKAIDILNRYSAKIDEVMQTNGLSQSIVDYVITKEEITPLLNGKNSTSPNWDKMFKNIKKKYGDKNAERTILYAKVDYYNGNQNWDQYLKFAIKKIEHYGLDTASVSNVVNLNYTAWMIFLHSTDKRRLYKAAEWMKLLITMAYPQPSWLDTYANLMYKYGKTDEAIFYEQQAASLEQENAIKFRQRPDSTYWKTLEKMKTGKPTWN